MRKIGAKYIIRINLGVVLFLLIFGTSVYPFAEEPQFEETPEKIITSSVQDVSVFDQKAGEEVEDVKPLSDEEIYDVEQQYLRDIKNKQFSDALKLLNKLPERSLDKTKREQKKHIDMFQKIENEHEESSSVFAKEEDLDSALEKTIKRLYREAQFALINKKERLATDILIQIIYLHRRNFRAKKLLEYGLDLKLGSYKVENMEEKYWNQSNIFFYGGNYLKAVDALKMLSYFDRENPEVYKRLGSSYYMMGEKKEAIGAWNTALFYKPNDKELKEVIAKTERLIKIDIEKAKERKRLREQVKEKEEVKVETTLLRITRTQKEAFNFAAQVKKQGLEPIIEELEDGRWAVKIPKKNVKK